MHTLVIASLFNTNIVFLGQSISHIYKPNDLPCTSATLYNYVAKDCFSARNIDLPRLVKMKKRKQRKTEPKDTQARTTRTYEDFQNFQKYIELLPELPIVEMDTVEGGKGSKVLLHYFLAIQH